MAICRIALLSVVKILVTLHWLSSRTNAATNCPNYGPAGQFGAELNDAETVNSRLTLALLRRHSIKSRPVDHPDERLTVNVLCALYQIVDVDQRSNLATISAYFDLWWLDQYLKWNVSEYGGTTETYLPSEIVWTPDLYLYHSVQGSTPLAVQQSAVHITHDGAVRVFIPFTARALCTINVKYFPFDTQQCEFVFGSWSYRMESVEYIVASEDVFLNDFYDNQEWTLINSTLHQTTSLYTNSDFNETYSTVTLRVALQRQSFYYVFNLVLPVTLVTVVSVIGFHVPADSSERRESKFRLGIMTLLSMGVLLLNVVNDMPKFSMRSEPGKRGSFSDVPLLGLFYVALIVIISVGTMSTGLFVALEKHALHNPLDVPWWMGWLDFDWPKWRGLWQPPKWPPLAGNRDDRQCVDGDNDEMKMANDAHYNSKGSHWPLTAMSGDEDEEERMASANYHGRTASTNAKARVTKEMLSSLNKEPDRTSAMSQSNRCSIFSPLRQVASPKRMECVVNCCGANRTVPVSEGVGTVCTELLREIRTVREILQKRGDSLCIGHAHKRQYLLTKRWSRVIGRLEMISLIAYLGLVCTALIMFFFYCWY